MHPDSSPESRDARVAVALDALAQLKSGGFQVISQYYLRVFSSGPGEPTMKSALDRAEVCQVCILGSLLVSTYRVHGRTPQQLARTYPTVTAQGIESVAGPDGIVPALADLFSEDQLFLMEIAFEGAIYASLWDRRAPADSDQALQFSRRYRSPRARLRAILQNVVANGGTFDPSQPVKRSRALAAATGK